MGAALAAIGAGTLALAIGLAVGWLAGGGGGAGGLWDAIKAAARRAALPVLVVVVAVGAIAGLIAAANEIGGSDQLWGQVIAGVSLLVVTVLLFAAGPRTYTVRTPFIHGEREYAANNEIPKLVYDALSDEDKQKVEPVGESYKAKQTLRGPIAYAVDQVIDEATYSTLGDVKQHIQVQRGLYFRGLYVGADGRWSTSKLQVLIWTYAVLYALLAFFIADELGLRFGGNEQGFGNLEFHDAYLLLLGGPFAAAVVAKGITSQRVDEGTELKSATDTPDQQSAAEGVREIVSDDSGRTSLPDFQYFMFNLVALTIFLVSFVPHLEEGLPELPDFLVALTSASALTYLGAKAVARQTPTIALVVPSKARRSEPVEVHGTNFTTGPDDDAPTVTVDGIPATATLTKRQRVPGDDVVLVVTIPQTAGIGPGKDLLVRPRGATATATGKVEVIDTDIASVEPESIAWSPGETVTIKGSGFGEEPATSEQAKALLGGLELDIVEWTDARIRAQLKDNVADAAIPTQPTVEIDRSGYPKRSLAIKVVERVMSITEVKQTPLKLVPGGLVEVSGTGFGSTPAEADAAEVRLGSKPLYLSDWSDQRILATLPPEVPEDLLSKAGASVGLVVARKGRRDASRSVDVALPAVVISTVSPESIPEREGEKLHVVGSGFGSPSDPAPGVTLGRLTLAVGQGHTDTLLVVTLPVEATSEGEALADEGKTETLIVRREGWQEALKPVKLTKPKPP